MNTYINEMTGEEWIEIEVAEGQYTAMPKALWDEQQAQKELGGTL